MIKYPSPLKKGDTIGICAPSSGVTGVFSNKLDVSIKNLNNLGYKCIETKSVRQNHKTVSTNSKTRYEEFMSLYKNPEVKAIIPPWGGEFLMDMLPHINLKQIEGLPPKWILGFSDTSTLLFILTTNSNIATAHGPNCLDFGVESIDKSVLETLNILSLDMNSSFNQKSLKKYQKDWLKVQKDIFPSYNLSEEVIWKSLDNENHKFSGRLIGGCMDVLCKIIGTPYDNVKNYINQFKDKGIIWYLESCEMNAGDIYRTLWQMKENGWFTNTNGFLYGRLEGYEDTQDFIYIDAFQKALGDINVPIIYDVDLGHKPPQLTLINGAYGKVKYFGGKGEINQIMK
ncbi:MAG: LD-carboxypeptidase [Bacillota bacterium]|nr:LD-carboxypeptidase [Bacillota bacterium]